METKYDNVFDYVDRYVRLLWDRNLRDDTSRQWCKAWFLHPEAVLRFEFLWQWYEHVSANGSCVEFSYYFAFFESQMEILTSPGGCFRHCYSGHVNVDSYLYEEFPIRPRQALGKKSVSVFEESL